MSLGCSPVEQHQRTGTEIFVEEMLGFERGWIASKDFQALRYDAGDGRRAQYGFELFATAK